jgi:uncharacterized protein (TIGR00369 family)
MTALTPADAEYAERIRDSFARQSIMATLGARITEVQPGRVTIELPYRADLAQQHGFVHAGVLATVADSACGYAAFSLMPAEAAVLSIEFKINLLSPARGERFVAEGHVVRAGRTITVCQAEVVAVEGERREPVAAMTATMMTVLGRPGLRG